MLLGFTLYTRSTDLARTWYYYVIPCNPHSCGYSTIVLRASPSYAKRKREVLPFVPRYDIGTTNEIAESYHVTS